MRQTSKLYNACCLVHAADNAADLPAAGASSQDPPSTSKQQSGASTPLSNLTQSLGQKAFVSEEEWRVMDKKVGVVLPISHQYVELCPAGNSSSGKVQLQDGSQHV